VTFDTEESLERFICAFEDGTWPGADWKHAHHVAMAAFYVIQYGRDEALRRARFNIAKYNESQGGKNTEDSGYHETLTVFWIDVVASAIPPRTSRLQAVNQVVQEFAPKRDLFRDYYSFDVVNSRDARAAYIPPDREWSKKQPET
jgi:hypothetical protein